MGSDFNSCRFDFRLDVKTGLLPSRRRRGNSTARGRSIAATSGGDRSATGDRQSDSGGRCTTLYSCKICRCLLRSRADRKAHTLQHKQVSQIQHSDAGQPHSELTNCSLNEIPLITLGVTHPGLRSNHGSQPVVVESPAVEEPSSSELGTANFGFLRSLFRPQHSDIVLPSAEESCYVIMKDVVGDATPDTTSSSLDFRPVNDIITLRDRDSVSGIISTSDPTCDNNFTRIYSSNLQTNDVLDLTTKATCNDQNRLPVLSTDDACNSDFRSPLVRQRKSRGLDLTVRKLWQFKLQQQQRTAADDVTLRALESSRSYDNDDDLGNNVESPGLRHDEATSRHVEECPTFETVVGKVTESRSPGHGESGATAELKLRRVVATPGEQPRFYTSLMRFQSSRRKTQPAQVSYMYLPYLLTYLLKP